MIEGNTLFPHPFPADFGALMRVALKQAPEANYHLSFLPQIAPWLLAYRANSACERRMEFATLMRPLFGHAISEHEALMAEADATRYLRKEGWLKVYRTEAGFRDTARERDVAAKFGLEQRVLEPDAARVLEPSLLPVFLRAVHWPGAASISNPLAVTRAYAARFRALGGVTLNGDARTLRRDGKVWRVDAEEGPVDLPNLVVALGPWAPDILAAARHQAAAGGEARLSPALPSAGQCGSDAARWSTPRSVIAWRRWSRASG